MKARDLVNNVRLQYYLITIMRDKDKTVFLGFTLHIKKHYNNYS